MYSTDHERDHQDLDVARLDQMVAEVDDAHRRSMDGLGAEIGELHRGSVAEQLGDARSHTLRNAALAGTALAVGATLLPYNQLLASAGVSAKLTDGDIAGYAQSVELAAVAAYTAAAAKITTPAVLGAAKAFMAHHQDHANAFGSAAGASAPGVPNATVLKAVGGQITSAADENAVLEIAFSVENAAAATYLFAIGALSSADALMLTASILPIEAQHAVVLGTVLQKDLKALFPDGGRSFETTTTALEPDKNPIK
jgi:hypothetical protein